MTLYASDLSLFLGVPELNFPRGQPYRQTIPILYPLNGTRVKVLWIDHLLHVYCIEELMYFTSIGVPEVERGAQSDRDRVDAASIH